MDRTIPDVNIQQSCEAAIRVKPSASFARAINIHEESAFLCEPVPRAPQARHSIATAVRPWIGRRRKIKARRAVTFLVPSSVKINLHCRIGAAPSALTYLFVDDPRPYGRGYLMTVLRTS
jgi:hypothetical protein